MSEDKEHHLNDEIEDLLQQMKQAEGAGDLEAALALCDRALELDGAYGLVSKKGLLLEKLGRIEDALAAFRRSTEIEPTFCDFYNAGNMELALGLNEEAVQDFEKSIALRDDYAEAWVNRGIALFNLGRNDEAGAQFKRAIEIKSDLVQAWRCKAILHRHQDELSAAEEAYEKVTQLTPESAQAWYELGVALGTLPEDEHIEIEPGGRDWRAVEALDRSIALAPENEHVWAFKANVLLRLAHGVQSFERAAAAAGVTGGPAFEEVYGQLQRHLADASERFPDRPFFKKMAQKASEELIGDEAGEDG